MIKRIALVIAFALGVALTASAAPISYIHSGFGSGTIDGDAFGSLAPAAFTITAAGDTSNIQSCGVGCFFIDNDSASIDIAGVGIFTFTTPTRYFSNNGVVGFSRAGLNGADLFNGPYVGFPWDMTTSVGPVSGDGNLMQWALSAVNTSGGVLFFNSASTDATFQARVPEPASLLLLGSGVALAVRRRTRRA